MLHKNIYLSSVFLEIFFFLKFLQIYKICHPKFVVQFGSIFRLFSNVYYTLNYEDLYFIEIVSSHFLIKSLKREMTLMNITL